MALVAYSAFDLQAGAEQTVDESQAIPTFVTLGGIATYEASGSKLGGPCRKFQAPTTDGGYSGYGQFQLNRNGAFGFQRMAMRFEMQIGSTWGSNNSGDAVKLAIINMTDTLGGATTTRPMLYLDARPGDGADSLKPAGYVGLGLAQGTNKRYSATAAVDYMDGSTPFFFGPAAGTWDGRRIVGANEWVSISYYMSSITEAGFPNGRLWMTVTHQDGTVLADFSHSYTIGSNSPADYFATMDVLGGYFNFATTSQADANNYLKIAYPTFQANATAPLPPRTGFVSSAVLPPLTPELTGWTKPNDTTLRSPDESIEIGDAMQTSFFPQFKKKKFNNQVNFSLRLSLPNYNPDNLTIEQNEVVYTKGAYQARFKYETGVPQTVNIGGTNYVYNGIENRFGFKIILGAAPPINSLDFTVVGSNISLHHQPALTGPQSVNEKRDAHVINSIAIKNTLGLKDARGSTKIGHLFRPTVVDSLGNRTWGDWSIINASTVRLTVPAAYLNTASYPVTIE